MKPRSIETEKVRSLHPDLAPVGTIKYMTVEEADFMEFVGRGERVKDNDAKATEPYKHREMIAERPRHARKG
jgi:hypothetical protein